MTIKQILDLALRDLKQSDEKFAQVTDLIETDSGHTRRSVVLVYRGKAMWSTIAIHGWKQAKVDDAIKSAIKTLQATFGTYFIVIDTKLK